MLVGVGKTIVNDHAAPSGAAQWTHGTKAIGNGELPEQMQVLHGGRTQRGRPKPFEQAADLRDPPAQVTAEAPRETVFTAAIALTALTAMTVLTALECPEHADPN